MVKWVTRLGLVVVMLLALLSSLSNPAQADDNNEYLELLGDTATDWNIGNIYPGLSGSKTFILHNASTVFATLSMWVTETAPQGELRDYLLFNISRNQSGTSLCQGKIDELPNQGNPLNICKLGEDGKVSIHWQWELPAETDNAAQNSSLSFTITFRLEQLLEELSLAGVGAPPSPPGTTDVRGIVVPPPELWPEPEPEPGLPPEPEPEPGPPPELEPEPELPLTPAPASPSGTTDVRGEVPLINWPVVSGIIVALVGLLVFSLIRRKRKKKAH